MPMIFGVSALLGCGGGRDGNPIGDTTYDVERLQDPETCKDCHPKHYREWSGSMHAYASDDPLFVAMNKRGQEKAQIGDFCVKCHAPLAVALGRTTDGLNLAELPAKLKGVGCYFCHNVDDVTGDHNNPLHIANDVVMRAQIADPVPNKAHRAGYSQWLDRSLLQSSKTCGSCHDIVNGHGAHLERTFEEWNGTLYATPYGNTCAQCHMVESAKQQPIAEGDGVTGVFARYTHDHQFPGVDLALVAWPEVDAQRAAVQAFLSTSLRSAVCVKGLGRGDASLIVAVDNIAAVHKWPSGAVQDRRAWFEVTAADANGAILYESGVVPQGTEPTALKDDDLWLLRDCIFDGDGKETHDFWDAVRIEPSALPGPVTYDSSKPEYYQNHIRQTYPRANGAWLPARPDVVTLRVWIQAFPLDLFDQLLADPESLKLTRAEVDAMRARLTPIQVLEQVWRASDVGTVPDFFEQQIPVYCKSSGRLNAGLSTGVPAKHMSCKP